MLLDTMILGCAFQNAVYLTTTVNAKYQLQRFRTINEDCFKCIKFEFHFNMTKNLSSMLINIIMRGNQIKTPYILCRNILDKLII